MLGKSKVFEPKISDCSFCEAIIEFTDVADLCDVILYSAIPQGGFTLKSTFIIGSVFYHAIKSLTENAHLWFSGINFLVSMHKRLSRVLPNVFQALVMTRE